MNKRLGCILLWTGAAVAAITGCQIPRATPVDRRLIAEVMTASELSANLRALAMPGGRLSGSPNGEQAEEYVAQKLREYGLQNVHFEPFPMISWRDRSTEVTVLGDPPHRLEVAQALGNCTSTPAGGITGELVDVGRGTPQEFEAKGPLLNGRFAMAHYGEIHRTEKMKTALEYGALGLIHVSHLDDQVVVGVCHKNPNPAPGVAICRTDGQKLAERMAAGETVKVNIKIDSELWACTPRNVVAEIPGTGPLASEVVIACAHLDSWHLAEGALDNGSGSAALLEAARALAKAHVTPRRTIRFVWFMGEEHGLCGSTSYVKAHKNELNRIIALINLDMPGEPRKFVTFGHPEVVKFLQAVATVLPGYELEPDVGESVHTESDHAEFMKQGVCCMSISGDLGPGVKYYHTNGDKYDQVDRRGLNGCAAVAAVLTRRLADSDPRPTERLNPDTLKEKYGW